MANEVTLTLDAGLRFTAAMPGGATLQVESPASGEQGTLPTPMEVQLVALGGCTAMDVISVLRKMRQEVASYAVRVSGERAEDHPRVYTTITLLHEVRGSHLNEAQVRRAIQLSMERYCPVFAMLSPTIAIEERYAIVDDATGATTKGVVDGPPRGGAG